MDGRTWIYIDEAGNFDFSPSGSKYFILTCLVIRRPFEHVARMQSLKYDCLEGAHGNSPRKYKKSHEFHATEDTQATRDAVFSVIGKDLKSAAVYSVIIRKNMTNPSLRPPEVIYAQTFEWLIGYVARHEPMLRCGHIMVVADRINLKRKNEAIVSSLKRYLKSEFEERGIGYTLYQHDSASDINLQMVDYCSWAIQRKWERDDDRSYSLIKKMVRKEGDLFKNGDYEYYKV